MGLERGTLLLNCITDLTTAVVCTRMTSSSLGWKLGSGEASPEESSVEPWETGRPGGGGGGGVVSHSSDIVLLCHAHERGAV